MWWTANPYSLSAPANARFLRITVKGVGDHSRALARLRPGTRVWAEGPYGALTAARRRRPQVLLVGGGVGISPLRALFETLPGQVTLVYMARRDEELILRGELDAIALMRGATVHYTVDELPGSTGGRSVPPDRTRPADPDPRTGRPRRLPVRAHRHDDRARVTPCAARASPTAASTWSPSTSDASRAAPARSGTAGGVGTYTARRPALTAIPGA